MDKKIIVAIVVTALVLSVAVVYLNSANVTGAAVTATQNYYCCGTQGGPYAWIVNGQCSDQYSSLVWASFCNDQQSCSSKCRDSGYSNSEIIIHNTISDQYTYCKCSSPVSRNCTDTDGGKNYFVQATVTEASGVSSGPYTDSCVSSAQLKEYYCDASKIARAETISCSSGQTCNSGACVSRTTCTDTDGRQDYDSKGTTRGRKYSNPLESISVSDVCVNTNSVKEYYCGGDGACEGNCVIEEIHSCSSGQTCTDGACMAGPSCTDSDGGKTYETKGMVTEASGSTDRKYTDSCIPGGKLKEYYCDASNVARIETVSCPGSSDPIRSCQDGACIHSDCDDSDGGNYPYIGGTVTYTERDPETSEIVTNKYLDKCENQGLIEYYCDSEGHLQTDLYPCPSDYYCGDPPFKGSSNPDSCIPYVCEDSDGGKNYGVVGETTDNWMKYKDYCTSGYYTGGFDNYVVEYSCDKNNKLQLTTHRCGYLPNTCASGRCV